MAELLFIQPNDMTETSVMGGNIDYDKIDFHILSVQLSVLEPLLGTLLYDKIIADVIAETITGVYQTIFVEFIKPITKNMAIAEFIEVASYNLDNAGIFKNQPTNTEIVDREEVIILAGKYRSLAQKYILRFNKFICKNTITEYKNFQDEVNADRNITLTSGWFFGKDTRHTHNHIDKCDL